MAGTEVMIGGVGSSIKESITTEKVEHINKMVGKVAENRENLQSAVDPHSNTEEDKSTTTKGVVSESPGKNKGNTPKKNDPRNVFAGPRQSPKKNPWTRHAQSDMGKDSGKEAVVMGGGMVSSGTETGGDGIGIEIPKGEVNEHVMCTVHVQLFPCFGRYCVGCVHMSIYCE